MSNSYPLNILVACEESQAVTIELRKRGHRAFSCDIDDCSGGFLQWHIKDDVTPLINGNCRFTTCDGKSHETIGKWDMIIAFPPCTYLTSAGNRHYSLKMNTEGKVKERIEKRNSAADFFMMFVNADCDRIAIENPIGYMNKYYRKPDQIIHPYFFATSAEDIDNYVQKRTCLWLKGLPMLMRISFLDKPKPLYICNGKEKHGKPIGWCEGIRGVAGGVMVDQKQDLRRFLVSLRQWPNSGLA